MRKARIKTILLGLFTTKFALVYILAFAISVAVGTFIENDFGTSSAQKLIYQAWWFELLLWLFGFTIIVNIFKFRMIQQRKWALVLLHFAIVIILCGAAFTRYFGYEGTMHIRENGSSNSIISSESYLKFKFSKGDRNYVFDEEVLFASLGNNNWSEKYKLGEDIVHVKVLDFLPNPVQTVETSDEGKPTIKIVVPGSNGREVHFLSLGDQKRIGNTNFNFGENTISNSFNIFYHEESLQFQYNRILTQMTMATRALDTLMASPNLRPLALRSLYSTGSEQFVFSEIFPDAKVEIKSTDRKVTRESVSGLKMSISINDETRTFFLKQSPGFYEDRLTVKFDQFSASVSYGPREIELPFRVHLSDFIIEKYPGTNNPSSYASEVIVDDAAQNGKINYRIYMNHILNYGGYRFFQSSFDKDEAGTYLSVNHDRLGTTVSYIGYTLLTLGMLMIFFSKKSRFTSLSKKIKKLRTSRAILALLLTFALAPSNGYSQSADNALGRIEINAGHAEIFSRLIAQDYQGRMKPVHTLSRELLRKVTKKEKWLNMNADQVLLSMFSNNASWYEVKFIKLGKHKELKRLVGISGKYASYRDFFNEDGSYKLQEQYNEAFATAASDRGTFEKEIIKLDEKINIVQMMFSGSLLRLVPNPADPTKTWMSNHEHGNQTDTKAQRFFSAYRVALQNGLSKGDYSLANQLLTELKRYQEEQGADIIPSQRKLKAEILLNKSRVFNRLPIIYLLLGLVFLAILFISVFNPNLEFNKVQMMAICLVILAFAIHTLGLGLRWYVSGRAPWSNGYESMIYIAWTTTLAGVLFTRKSIGGMSATMVLSSTLLFVSTLSFLDPEITPLVPVLKSYWLTIHVSLEAGSYGFLLLGALIGIINLILLALVNSGNLNRVKSIIKEMSYLSEMILIAGLVMVSVGTYLGGVWANESWGRYWGWDAKETWALITILVYAFILHMRLVPKMKGLFTYNVATIFGLGSVIMTYFGVNYYLSGLHSYATGDPIPIPTWVYIFVAGIFILCTLGFLKAKKFKLS